MRLVVELDGSGGATVTDESGETAGRVSTLSVVGSVESVRIVIEGSEGQGNRPSAKKKGEVTDG